MWVGKPTHTFSDGTMTALNIVPATKVPAGSCAASTSANVTNGPPIDLDDNHRTHKRRRDFASVVCLAEWGRVLCACTQCAVMRSAAVQLARWDPKRDGHVD